MSHILLITSSPRGADSLSSRLATELAAGIKARTGGTLTVRDLTADPLPTSLRPTFMGALRRQMPEHPSRPKQ
jgi:FMN-dependent NADH-azoreductase